jgi:hypothetical protein
MAARPAEGNDEIVAMPLLERLLSRTGADTHLSARQMLRFVSIGLMNHVHT